SGSRLIYSVFPVKPYTCCFYSTGGADINHGEAGGMAVSADGDVWLTGATRTPDWPTVNALQAAYSRARDAYLLKVNPDGFTVFSTYLGGSGTDFGRGVAIGPKGAIHVTGVTGSADARNGDVFVVKITQ